MPKIIDQAYQKAIEVLKSCSREQGFYASGLPGGYEATWSRDSMISCLGACLVGNEFKKDFKNSLELLALNQSELGQIPNCVGSYNVDRRSVATFNTIDSTLWFIIGEYVFAEAYQDNSLLNRHKNSIVKAFVWLTYQDPNEDKLLAQQPTMDWQDAFPHKYGRTINTHALYYAVLNMIDKMPGVREAAAKHLYKKIIENEAPLENYYKEENKEISKHHFASGEELGQYIKKIINGQAQKYLSLYNQDLGYYYPWSWKNHDGDLEHEEWFDSLGNILAIAGGLATPKIAGSILNFIDKENVNRPYPCKAIWPYIKPDDKEWHSYFSKCNARDPYNYLNAGIWPFIGGFYVATLVKMKQHGKAAQELALLAEGVMQKTAIRSLKGEYEFNEWFHGKIGQPLGEPYQAWTAGAYIYGYECVKRKKVLFF